MREDDRLQGLILLLLKDFLPDVRQALTQRQILGDRDPLAGLKEAVAYRVGRSREERAIIRKQVGRLYELRSSFVHIGEVLVSESQQREVLELVRTVLKREIDDLQVA